MRIEDRDDEGMMKSSSSDDESSADVTSSHTVSGVTTTRTNNPQSCTPVRRNPPRKAKKKSMASTYRMLRQDNPRADAYTNDEMDYYMTLDVDLQSTIADAEKRLAHRRSDAVPLRFRILQSGLDDHAKTMALKKLDLLQKLDTGSSEHAKQHSWLEALSRMPIGRYAPLPVAHHSPFPEKQAFLARTRERLDAAVYGHAHAKEHVLRLLAQWLARPDARGLVIGLVGPMGVGKTQFALHGIAGALDLPFMFVPLGGANDSSVLDGFLHTYEGSTYGRIADGLMRAGVTNPVMYFDELDKISDSARGEEVMHLLIHMTDPTQNHRFTDKYFGGNVAIDLSRALMVFSFNALDAVNPILRDRMYCVHVPGYTIDDKVRIAQKHLVPDILDQHGMTTRDVTFSDDVLRAIVSVHLCPSEAGVRGLKRALGVVIGQINLLRIMGDASVSAAPYHVSRIEQVSEWLKHGLHDARAVDGPPMGMYC